MDGFGWVIWMGNLGKREREKTQREGDRERQRGDREETERKRERERVRETFGPSVDSPDTYASQQLTPTIQVSHL